eukprot:2439730-Pyramimonas_sp.AAC.1
MDVNSGFGERSDGVPVAEEHAGEYNRAKQNMSGDLAEKLCLTRNLCSPSTWYSEGGPTFFGSKGASSTIDH